MVDSFAVDHDLSCRNPNCKSYGRSHYNCRCYSHAKGGIIDGRFCSKAQMHNPGCEYYLASGGEAGDISNSDIQPEADFHSAVGHAAAEQGLLGLLRDVGHKKLQDHEKHTNRLSKEYNPEKLAGSALTGTISPSRLTPIMQKLEPQVQNKEPSSEAFRNSVDYLASASRGHNELNNKTLEFFDPKGFSHQTDDPFESREALKKHLEEVENNPQKALEIGGTLGHYLPEHAASLAAHSAQAINYLRSLKPKRTQSGPLDMPSPEDPLEEQKYNRALDIANQPLMALHHAKEGALQPQDVRTLSTLYPHLHQSMVSKLGEGLIDAKTRGVEIPHHQRLSTSMLMGQPLDSSFSSQSMQTIIKANSGAQTPQTQNNQKKPKKASGVELNQINKVNEMSELPSQSRLSNSKA